MPNPLSWLSQLFDAAQQWLFEAVVQPLLFALGQAGVMEDAYAATGWLLVGLLQLMVMLAVIAPLECWRPVEPLRDRAAVRTDVIYTLVHRLGLVRVLLFFATVPLWDGLFGALRTHGWQTWQLDALWPGVTDQPLVSLLLYLLAFDLVDYWIHRGQHRFDWWWRLRTNTPRRWRCCASRARRAGHRNRRDRGRWPIRWACMPTHPRKHSRACRRGFSPDQVQAICLYGMEAAHPCAASFGPPAPVLRAKRSCGTLPERAGKRGQQKTPCHRHGVLVVWRSLRDSNPCFSLERATSWASRRRERWVQPVGRPARHCRGACRAC